MKPIDKGNELVQRYGFDNAINIINEILWTLNDMDVEYDTSGFIDFWEEAKSDLQEQNQA